jgi:hypothetical protein
MEGGITERPILKRECLKGLFLQNAICSGCALLHCRTKRSCNTFEDFPNRDFSRIFFREGQQNCDRQGGGGASLHPVLRVLMSLADVCAQREQSPLVRINVEENE